jgi:CPA2 family monovalent cation:H+ antiporter-2
VVAAIFRLGGLGWPDAVKGALLLGQGGEFAFIVIGYATNSLLMDAATGQFIMLVVGLSLFVTPAAARLGNILAERWDRRGRRLDEVEPPSAERLVVIAGFGRVGRLLGELLTAQGIRYIALENDADMVARCRADGFPVYFGNAARAELLHKVNAREAAAIVLTMDHPASALHAVQCIRREFPQVPLFVRSRDEAHARVLRESGATLVIPETLEAALQLSALVLEGLGMEEEQIDDIIDDERARRLDAPLDSLQD